MLKERLTNAKDGDVLQLGEVTAIFKEYIGNENCRCYCSVCEGEFEIPIENGEDNIYGCTNTTPATKEQRDALFEKMKEAGYEWNAEKRELKKVEQKPAWSEEDEEMLDGIILRCEKYGHQEQINWLKSIKQRIGG